MANTGFIINSSYAYGERTTVTMMTADRVANSQISVIIEAMRMCTSCATIALFSSSIQVLTLEHQIHLHVAAVEWAALLHEVSRHLRLDMDP